jgi:hypothetical protein
LTVSWACSNSSVEINGAWTMLLDQTHSEAVVPAMPVFVADGDVFDIEEHFVAALLVPHLAAGVARVEQDRPHRGRLPHFVVPVRVAAAVIRRRAGDPIACQSAARQSQARQ